MVVVAPVGDEGEMVTQRLRHEQNPTSAVARVQHSDTVSFARKPVQGMHESSSGRLCSIRTAFVAEAGKTMTLRASLWEGGGWRQ